MRVLFLILFLLFFGENPWKVVGVTDGDTIVLLSSDKTQIKVRLDGIDCPESGQAYGQKAKLFTSDFCFGKEVILIDKGKDRYGRTLGIIIVDKDTLNYELLKAGYAWHDKQYNKEKRLSDMEQQARIKKVGLWNDPSPIAPWVFRKNKKKT